MYLSKKDREIESRKRKCKMKAHACEKNRKETRKHGCAAGFGALSS